MSKYTQGPWEVCIDDARNVRTTGGNLVASCCVADSLPYENARLIALAPELLGLLKKFHKHISAACEDYSTVAMDGYVHEIVRAAQEIINKAEGK